MSIESEKQIIESLLLTAEKRVAEAKASLANGDLAKCKVRIEQYNDALKSAHRTLGIAGDAILVETAAKGSVNEVI